MSSRMPPPPTIRVATGDDDRIYRLRFRLWQLSLTMITIFGTVWIMLFGNPLASIAAIALAKHVLVAIYLMGLNIYPIRLVRRTTL